MIVQSCTKCNQSIQSSRDYICHAKNLLCLLIVTRNALHDHVKLMWVPCVCSPDAEGAGHLSAQSSRDVPGHGLRYGGPRLLVQSKEV